MRKTYLTVGEQTIISLNDISHAVIHSNGLSIAMKNYITHFVSSADAVRVKTMLEHLRFLTVNGAQVYMANEDTEDYATRAFVDDVMLNLTLVISINYNGKRALIETASHKFILVGWDADEAWSRMKYRAVTRKVNYDNSEPNYGIRDITSAGVEKKREAKSINGRAR